MTRQQLIEFFEETMAKMLDTMKRKNADYAGGQESDSVFANFETVQVLGIATTEQGFLTRMTDKLCRISNLTKATAQVKDESIEDTLLDMSIYSLLFAAFLKSKPKAPIEIKKTGDFVPMEETINNLKHRLYIGRLALTKACCCKNDGKPEILCTYCNILFKMKDE